MRFAANFHRSCLAAVAGLLIAAPTALAADPVFTEFTGGVAPGFSANTKPDGIGRGPDGNVWMTQWGGAGRISKVTPTGGVTELTGGVTPGLTSNRGPMDVVAGPDGNVWVTQFSQPGGIVRITPARQVTEFPLPLNRGPAGITIGPDGDVWFVEQANPGRVAKITTGGEVSTVATGGTDFSANGFPREIALGPDGNIWFTEVASPGRIGRVTPAGVVTEFTGGVTPGFSFDSEPFGITAGPDGNLWFTEYRGSRIARITPAGVVTEFGLMPDRWPSHITAGPDGNLWFTESGSPGGIGRITPAGVVTEFLAGSTPGFTAGRHPSGITTSADGTLWFTENSDPGAVVRVTLGLAEPTPSSTPTATGSPGSDPGPDDPTVTATPLPGPMLPQLPRVTALASGVPMVTGAPALLSADVAGDPQRLDWDLNGDGRTEVSCPGDYSTLRYRPQARAAGAARATAGTGSVSVRPIGASGAAGPALSQTFEVAPAPALAKPIKDALTKVIAGQPPVYVCGLARDYSASQTELTTGVSTVNRYCYGREVVAGTLRIKGCLATVDGIDDIPPAERGIVKQLLSTMGVTGGTRSQTVLRIAERIVGAADGFVTTGTAVINGVEVTPGPRASIVGYTQVHQIVSSDAALNVGGIELNNPRAFSLDTKPTGDGRIDLGRYARGSGPITGLGDFPLVGDLGLTLVPGTAGVDAGSEIRTSLKLPSFLNFVNGPATADVTLRVTGAGEIVLTDMHIRIPDVLIGALELTDFQLDFAQEGHDRVWRGQGRFCLLAKVCVDAAEHDGVTPPGGVVIRNGKLERAFVNVSYDPGLPLYPNVFLTSVGAGAGLNPTRLLGSVGVTSMGIYRIDGRVVIAFPSVATPYKLNRGEFGGLTDRDYEHSFSQFMMAAAGTAYLQVKALDQRFELGNGYFVYGYPGYVHVGGHVNESFGGVISLEGETSGEFNLANGRFNFSQDIKACILEYVCRGSATRLSSAGVGACATIENPVKDIHFGGGVRFDPFDILFSLTDCDWSEFEDRAVFDGKAAAAQAGGPMNITIKRGDPSRTIRFDGADGAPRVRVTAPGGQVLESPPGADITLTPALRIMRSERIKATFVGLKDPKPGTYRLESMPASPAISKVTVALQPPPARVSARVRGTAATRTLAYDVLRRPDQKVTFVEVAAAGKRTIGAVTGGRGTLRFRPAPGTDRRRIEAQIELAGIGTETRTVAAFTPPSPRLGRPARVTVRRRATRLIVAWTRVRDAARYELMTTLSSGEQRITRVHQPGATIAMVPRSSGGRVTVSAVAPMRAGRPTTARFRATAPRMWKRFGPLRPYSTERVR